ncbi:hypothetical protein [Dongia sp.]|uniref:hypothetical protein n=1 Tax=Dongia sp. TaxID=1977262 RepID=UPI0034A37912
MTRKKGFLYLAGLALAFQLALFMRFAHVSSGITREQPYVYHRKIIDLFTEFVGGWFGLTLWASLLPLIIWACFKFRSSATGVFVIASIVAMTLIFALVWGARSYDECRASGGAEAACAGHY